MVVWTVADIQAVQTGQSDSWTGMAEIVGVVGTPIVWQVVEMEVAASWAGSGRPVEMQRSFVEA